VSVKGVAKVMVINVEAEVMNHTLFPDSAKTYDEAYFLTIFYGLKKGIKITEYRTASFRPTIRGDPGKQRSPSVYIRAKAKSG
jgi:hypothetical protein